MLHRSPAAHLLVSWPTAQHTVAREGGWRMVLMSIVRSALSVFMRASGIAVVVVATLVAVSSAKAEYAKLSDDLTLHYEQTGQGPQTILFIPGWTMSTKVFEHQFKHFETSTRVRAIAYDPRGQGLSS